MKDKLDRGAASRQFSADLHAPSIIVAAISRDIAIGRVLSRSDKIIKKVITLPAY